MNRNNPVKTLLSAGERAKKQRFRLNQYRQFVIGDSRDPANQSLAPGWADLYRSPVSLHHFLTITYTRSSPSLVPCFERIPSDRDLGLVAIPPRLLLYGWIAHFEYHTHMHWGIFTVGCLIGLLIAIFPVSIHTLKAVPSIRWKPYEMNNSMRCLCS